MVSGQRGLCGLSVHIGVVEVYTDVSVCVAVRYHKMEACHVLEIILSGENVTSMSVVCIVFTNLSYVTITIYVIMSSCVTMLP